MGRALTRTAAFTGLAAAAGMAWAVRGRSSNVFGPSVWRGRRDLRAMALTFDDGPSPRTPELLDVLADWGVRATFFVCGVQVRRSPQIARQIADAGHELGNHTDTHQPLWMRRSETIRDEVQRAQETINLTTGVGCKLFRAPYGVRWFGLREVLNEYGLTGVMWTVIGRDWVLPAHKITERIVAGASNGGILCLHDGRQLDPAPDISNTIAAVREIVPRLLDRGFTFGTVADVVGDGRSSETE